MQERGRIKESLDEVLEQIAQGAKRVGKRAQEIRLICVSKTKSAQMVREAYEAGQRDFGENYVQEMVEKAGELADLKGIRWHMIGHVQTNKVKMMMGCVTQVQSVDSERLARELERRAQEAGRSVDVMIEVNVGGEAQKSGIGEGEVEGLVKVIEGLGALRLRGLMTVPPYEEEALKARGYFGRLRMIRERLGGAERIAELSMGMSHDFMEAIDEGATTVRIGSAIFGTREHGRRA